MDGRISKKLDELVLQLSDRFRMGSLMKWLQIFSLLTFCGVCHAQQVARIDTRSFHDPERGVTQLIRVLESENRGFFALEPKKRDAEMERIGSVCINDRKHKEDQVCRTIDSIALALEQFARERKILLLFDPRYGNLKTLHGQLNLDDAEDITPVFVQEYNRLNP